MNELEEYIKKYEKEKKENEVKTQVLINKNLQLELVNIFLPIDFSICFGCSKEPSH